MADMDIKEVVIENDKLEKFSIDDIANENPMLTDEQYKLLKDDIEANGQLHPVVIHNYKIVDGRNRFKAIQELGMALKAVYVNSSREDAIKLATSYNDKRRHMSKSQYAMRAAKAVVATRGNDKDKKIPKTEWLQLEDTEEVKNKLVSVPYVENAIKLLKYNEDLAEKVFTGEQELSDALRSLSNTGKSTKETKDKNIAYFTKEYTKEVADDYSSYLKRGKFTKELLAKELVELKQKLKKYEPTDAVAK